MIIYGGYIEVGGNDSVIHTQCNRASKPCVYTTCLYDVEDGDVAMVAVFESWSGHHHILWL